MISEETRRRMSEAAKNRHISPEGRKRLSLSRMGSGNPFFGKKHNKESREKIGLHALGNKRWLGKKHKDESKLKISKSNLGRKREPFSEEHKRKIGDTQKGELNHNWQGGKTRLDLKIRNSSIYSNWRFNIFKRDTFTCQWCGSKEGGKLNADHIKPFSIILEENNINNFEQALTCNILWDLNNGRTLCESCHRKTESYNHHKKKTFQLDLL